MGRRCLAGMVFILAIILLCPNPIQAKLVKKVDGFEVLVDLSRSTGDLFKKKTLFEGEVEFLRKMNDAVPKLGYKAALRTFGYRSSFSPQAPFTRLDWGVKTFDPAQFGPAIDGLKPTYSITPLGHGMAASEAEFAAMPGKKALIILSDFRRSTDFGDPLGKAKSLKAKFGADLCIYTFCFGVHDEAFKLAKEIARVSDCGKFYDAEALLADQAAFAAMIKHIFYEEVQEPPPPPKDSDGDGVVDDLDKCPDTPKGLKVDKDGCPEPVTITLDIEFDTSKAVIKPVYHQKIAEVAGFLKQYPNTLATIEGHTDSRGPDKYNLRLSQRRADSVRSYLIEKFGIAADRLKAVGYGETKPIADNKTLEGRQKNRRVDVIVTGAFKSK